MNEENPRLTIDQFASLSAEQRVNAFGQLPVSSQKVLVSLSAFFSDVGQVLLTGIRDPLTQQINKAKSQGKILSETEIEEIKSKLNWTPEEFDKGLNTLTELEYVRRKPGTSEGNDRFEVAPQVKQFVNIDLRRVWEEQKKKKTSNLEG